MQELMPANSPYQGSELSGAAQQPLQLEHHHHHQVLSAFNHTSSRDKAVSDHLRLGVGEGGSTIKRLVTTTE